MIKNSRIEGKEQQKKEKFHDSGRKVQNSGFHEKGFDE